MDNGEIGHPNLIIQAQPGNYFFPTGDSTYYSYVVDTGAAYTITANAIPYYNITPLSQSTPVLSYAMVDSLNDFALQRNGIVHDLNVNITSTSWPRRGFDVIHTLTVKNNGTVTDTASLQYVSDPNLTFVSSSPAPDVINGDTLTWNTIRLVPGKKLNFNVTLHIGNQIPNGTNLTSYATANPIAGDSTPADNVAALHETVVGSYDPNGKTVEPSGAISIDSVAAGEWLDYTVRFQNTGTAAALKVEIQDTLSSNLDLKTIQIVASSHPMTWSIRKSIAFFEFDNINLPDSTTDETNSHGFVRYRVKANTSLSAGDVINNTAYIYFDKNPYIQTNTAGDTVTFPLFVDKTHPESGLWLYPNPANDKLYVMCSLSGKGELRIFNLLGQEASSPTILQRRGESIIDASNLPKGVYFIQLKTESSSVVKKFIKD